MIDEYFTHQTLSVKDIGGYEAKMLSSSLTGVSLLGTGVCLLGTGVRLPNSGVFSVVSSKSPVSDVSSSTPCFPSDRVIHLASTNQ